MKTGVGKEAAVPIILAQDKDSSMPSASLHDLAQLTSGTVIGDTSTIVDQALPLQDASEPCITLADDPSHLVKLRCSDAVAVVVREELEDCPIPMLVVSDLHSAFIQIICHLRPPISRESGGISGSTNIHPTAELGKGATILPGASIASGVKIGDNCTVHAGVTILEDCTVGENATLYPGVTLYDGTKIGKNVLVHAGATIGAYGFGYKQVQGTHVRTAQLGWVEIGDNVEIGAGTTIDRGTYGATKIGTGTKIDNQVQIGHNCHIGRHNLICAQVGIAGSSSTGDYVVLAGQVGIADHMHLADRAIASAQSGIMQCVGPGDVVFGTPAGPLKRKMQESALVNRLPELRRDVRGMKKQLAELTAQLEPGEENAKPARKAA